MRRETPLPRPAWLVLFSSVLLVAGSAALAASEATEVIATYDGGSITARESAQWVAVTQQAEREGPPELSNIMRIALVKALEEPARAHGFGPDVEPAVEQFRSALLEEELRRHVFSRVTVDEEQVEALFRDHPHFMDQPRKVLLFNIFKELPGGADEAAKQALREQMEGLREQLLHGADFSEVAERESDSSTRYAGGRIGFVRPGRLAAEIEEVAFSLAEGEISEVIEAGDGLTILKAGKTVAEKIYPPDEVRAVIRDRLRRQSIESTWLGIENKARRAEELGLVPADMDILLAWRRRQLLADAEVERMVERERKPVTDEEVRQTYVEGHDRYRAPEAWELEVLHLAATEPEEVRDAHERMRAILADVRSGDLTFEEAARTSSDHTSAEDGGRLGWLEGVRIAAFGPRALKAVKRLAPGEWTGILHFESGLWVFRLLDQRPQRPLSFEEAAPRIRSELERTRDRDLEISIRSRIIEGLDVRPVERAKR